MNIEFPEARKATIFNEQGFWFEEEQ